MAEFAEFNAIRIALASPEQIKTWSYGEVTKPETINYRTLKPEKDGLFCERIFGPTKDFECACGKYKRLRFKGIICDRCGVEVTRSKVRRERMGHIDLAAPVAHIWFARGTPSRLGLLLDLSPRSLERVLYFAQYIVTEVKEGERQKLLKEIQDEMKEELEKVEDPFRQQMTALEKEHAKRLADLEKKSNALRAQFEKAGGDTLSKAKAQATAAEGRLQSLKGKKAPEDITLGDSVLVKEGKTVTAAAFQNLKKRLAERLADLDKDIPDEKRGEVQQAAAFIEEEKEQANQQLEALQTQMDQQRMEVEDLYQARLDQLEELRPLLLLNEANFKEMKDKHGDLFKASMGAEAVLEILRRIDLATLREDLLREVRDSSGQRRKKATKRLRVVESFRKSGNKADWMVLTVLPVLPPDLRPMVQLDGGRFATSDLNDLYRRVINRNNRLKRLLELGAPEIIIRNEKRMLQEAVDALIDNGRRGRAVAGSHNHRLKSLSDMLRGKQGRFRQNLLGKRVDYSARSVIVVGPELRLHQCGLPKKMALELFKPFVMHKLVAKGLAHNIKSAKRMVERMRPEVWDVLDEVIKTRPVMLNRAPTLHRLGIQAFEPVLIEGSAVQIHPLVCPAFNADFDGDQMAVHVPLSKPAVYESRNSMLSVKNMLSPASGEPLVAPSLDIVLGCYYLTSLKPSKKPHVYSSPEEAKLAHELGHLGLQEEITVRLPSLDGAPGERVNTTVGRLIFSEVLPKEMGFANILMDKKTLKKLVSECHHKLGSEATANMLDAVKNLGFHYATRSGITIAISDLEVPEEKRQILERAEQEIADIEKEYQRGLMTDDERYRNVVEVWTRATDELTKVIEKHLPQYGGVYLMATSGAKGNIAQIKQMAGMRGLMSDPRGRIIALPIKASFVEGLSMLEYFISTHGARKGLADTALRTADSGYLTRRMIDVAQEVIIQEHDCGSTQGVWIYDQPEKQFLGSFGDRIVGRMVASPVAHPQTGEIIVDRNEEINEEKVQAISKAKVTQVYVRSPLTCVIRRGMCALCYGRSLGRGIIVTAGEAVGIIAAQSIGEPGTQLTMRTFHTGGVAGVDITSGLPRVEELFEARSPKGQAVLAEIDGEVEITEEREGRHIRVFNAEVYKDQYPLPPGYKAVVKPGQQVEPGTVLAEPPAKAGKGKENEVPALQPVVARLGGRIHQTQKNQVVLLYEEREERVYSVPLGARLRMENGSKIRAGDALTEGPKNPQDILRIQGSEAVQQYLVEEVQQVYRSQGVTINDKHIEIIIRQMLRRVRIDSPGDTDFMPGELVDHFEYEKQNARVLAEGGEPATAQPVLLGITKASLHTDSFLAAASFQETTRVLTEAALQGKIDHLLGLKENVIIGRLIPARQEYPAEVLVATPRPEVIPFPTAAEPLQPTGVAAAALEFPPVSAGGDETPPTDGKQTEKSKE
ncbi:MAG: DNA-directed RNA polymerase subunit beta' [Chloroflexi bacterium]|nr:DNA-directed RNA polymerase subunit beta' [Chloroflexota bacterium]